MPANPAYMTGGNTGGTGGNPGSGPQTRGAGSGVAGNGPQSNNNPSEEEEVCHYGSCNIPKLEIGEYVTDGCGLPWDQAINFAVGQHGKPTICEYKFTTNSVYWIGPLHGWREGRLCAEIQKREWKIRVIRNPRPRP
ncbi:MAG: hypothetical protein Tsb009_30700 [Planctomycetaceae bacterium]